jgi:hypothetical protein
LPLFCDTALFGEDAHRTGLRLVHTGLAGDLGVLHDDGWSRFLARLAATAAGGEPAAYPAERPDERLAALHRQGHQEQAGMRRARWPLTS